MPWTQMEIEMLSNASLIDKCRRHVLFVASLKRFFYQVATREKIFRKLYPFQFPEDHVLLRERK